MSFSAQDILEILEKKKQHKLYPYRVKTKYGRELQEETSINEKFVPPRTLKTGVNTINRPSVR